MDPETGDLSGRPDDGERIRKPLYDELGSVGKQHYPLEPASFLNRPQLLNCPAVVRHAGWPASREKLAQSASTVLRDLITKLSDETERLIAEAAFALDERYQGKSIGKRQELLARLHGISANVYSEHRREVFEKLIYGLQTTPETGAEVVPVSPFAVGEAATTFFYACVATKLLIAERIRLLGDSGQSLREPNLTLYTAHINFLLVAHRYLHTLPDIESMAEPVLTRIFGRIVAGGPLGDIVYLAHIYGGRDKPEYPHRSSNESADLLLRSVWREWYLRQETIDTHSETDLHALSVAVAEFRNVLPQVWTLGPAGRYIADELEAARLVALTVFNESATYKMGENAVPFARTLSDVLSTEVARTEWVAAMAQRLEDTVRAELATIVVDSDSKAAVDGYIAFRLHHS